MKLFLLPALALALLSSFTTKAKNLHTAADSVAINMPAPEFKLKDMSGKTVSLSSFRGKVVVIDFWATWCAPCHQNFPALQKTLDHYKGDTSVVFLFIDTRETSVDFVKLAKADMAKNKYDFRVLFDETGADGGQNKYYKAFGMLGIPTQFVLDRQGIVRHKAVGFDPRYTEEQHVADEIQIIESVKSKN